MENGGWDASAEAWVRFMDEGDPNRTHLLDPVMLGLCDDVRGQLVLDAGCGEGRFFRMLAERGAHPVGLDPAPELLAHARDRSEACRLVKARAEQLPFRDGSFDLAVSYVALVDIPDHRAAISEVARVLRPGGRFVACNVSAFTTALGRWVKDEKGVKQCYAFDRYGEEFSVACAWRGIEVLQHHRPLSSVLSACLDSGLVLERFLEPHPTPMALAECQVLEDFSRMPNFYAMAWRKP